MYTPTKTLTAFSIRGNFPLRGSRFACSTARPRDHHDTDELRGRLRVFGACPGRYSIQEIQPAEYLDGDEGVGTAGGDLVENDLISNIDLPPATDADDYHFCEIPPGTISGYVFQDGPAIEITPGDSLPNISTIRDGKHTSDDLPLGGVVLELRNGVTGEPILGSQALPGLYAADQTISAVTDENGHFEFRGLAPGNYAVFETQPRGYIDSLDTPGSLGGIAINPSQSTPEFVLTQLLVAHHDDAILRIALPAGQTSVENNFSEVRVESPFFLTPPPPETVAHCSARRYLAAAAGHAHLARSG